MEISNVSSVHSKCHGFVPQPKGGRCFRGWLLLVAIFLLMSSGIPVATAADGQVKPVVTAPGGGEKPTTAVAPGASEKPAVAPAGAGEAKDTPNAMSVISNTCVSCHSEDNRGIIQQWGNSKHYGANVGCYECHKAEEGDPDAFMHKKYLISTLVTPKDCARCHATETKQFAASSHARAGSNLDVTIPHTLATMVQGDGTKEGTQAATSGCVQCHGSKIEVNKSGKLLPHTWPNSGIGRVNPDGSLGSCTACHQRHDFSLSQARRPETCGKCHQGSAHPQKDVYNESKHGISFYSNVEHMNLSSPKWIPGQDYYSGPTCTTCHMSGTLTVGMTHDVGKRVSWNLAQPISKPTGDDSDARRDEMKSVCFSCHTERYVENFYSQFDNTVNLYNSKYGEPGSRLMEALLKSGLRTEKQFDDPIEWVWFKLWHVAGRNARSGAAMLAPDFAQWKGFAELAELFYSRLLPEADALITKAEAAGRGAQVAEAKKVLLDIKNDPANVWMKSSGQ